MSIQKRVGYAMIAFWAVLMFEAKYLDWYRGGDMGFFFWAFWVFIAVYLATK